MIKLISITLITAVLSFGASILPPKAKIDYVMDFDKTTVCVVRHFKIYKDPKWACKIELKNGKKLYFSSPKSLIEFYHRPGKWFDIGVKSEADFRDIIVTDFITMKPINAKDAYYIYGSKATSSSGDDLVAIGNEADAKNFNDTYNGKRILKFNEIPDALIRLLNGRI